ncbi:hypothetical protein P9112_007080 [Eukaryota sp. TZLM1-RC]
MNFPICRVTSKLQKWYTVLTAELREIEQDIRLVRQLKEKYNSKSFVTSIQKLESRQNIRQEYLKRIETIMKLHSLHIDSGKSLIKKLTNEFNVDVDHEQPDVTGAMQSSRIMSQSYIGLSTND